MVISFSSVQAKGGGGGGATGGTISGVTLWSDETTKAYVDDALTAYTPTIDFATINGSAITAGGNIEIDGAVYSAGTNIDIDENNFISVTGITGYTGITSQEVIDALGFTPISGVDLSNYYTSAQTDTAIDNAISGKADSSAVTQDIADAIAAETARTESTYLKEHQSLENYYTSGQTDAAIDNAVSGKMDTSGMSAYATTAWTEQTYIKEHQSLSAYTPTSGFATINSSAITEGGNISITPYTGITSQEVVDALGYTPISGVDLTNYYTSAQTQSAITDAVSDKQKRYEVSSLSEITNPKEGDIAVVGGVINYTASNISGPSMSSNYAPSSVTLYQTNEDPSIYMGYAVDPMWSFEYVATSFYYIDNAWYDGFLTNNISLGNWITLSDSTGQGTPLPTTPMYVFMKEWGGISLNGAEVYFSETPTLAGASVTYQYNNGEWIRLGEVDISEYWTSAQTNTAISNAVSGKMDTSAISAYTPTSGFSTVNGSAITVGGNIVIESGGESFVELTQAQYDALTAYTPNTTYIITDAQEVDMANYYTSAQTNTAISNAVSGKTDKVSVTASGSGYKFVKWNNQGVITGATTAYQASGQINGTSRTVYSTSSTALPNIYAPTSVGTAGQPLLSNGSGAPVWGAYKFQFITQSAYDTLATKDATTIYFIIG